MNKEKGRLISFGLGGHSIEFAPQGDTASSLSGYENPESFVERCRKGDYAEYDLEDAYIIDKREILQENPTLAYTVPMVSTSIDPGAVDKLSHKTKKQAAFLEPALQGSFGTLARLAQEPEYSGLDYVGLNIYRGIWRAYGAKTGIFKNGSIVWDK